MTEPYRALAVVEPIRTDPVVHALRLAGARPFVWLRGDPIEGAEIPLCRVCGANHYFGPKRGPHHAEKAVCSGRRCWWRPWGCDIRVLHFHMRCASCKVRWIMAPRDVEL